MILPGFWPIRRLAPPFAYGQHAFLRDAAGQPRASAFIRLEHLAQDRAPLEAHLGFALGPIARQNASDRCADYRGYYSPASADMLAEDCAEDIARFGYRFDP